jgi:hypothetical protein
VQGVQGAEAAVSDSGWVSVTSFDNSFVGNNVAYRKLNGVVFLRGNVSAGTGETVAFTLPVGYRPAVEHVVLVQKYGTPDATYVTINTSGGVIPHDASAWLSAVVFLG